MELITFKKPKSPVSEAYKTLRTNILFSSLDNHIKTMVVTSSGPGEGKTTVTSNLAVTFAQNGNKTIILDCDLRKSKIHRLFNLSNQVGLSNILIGETSFAEENFKTEVENLYVIPAGTRPPNPAELLSSERMQQFLETLKQNFDTIIIDTPPVLMVTDAQILSKYADGVILVVSSGEADKNAAQRSKVLLEKVNARILGVVLNKLDTTKKGYYGYYYYYYYGNDSNAKQNTKKRILPFGK